MRADRPEPTSGGVTGAPRTRERDRRHRRTQGSGAAARGVEVGPRLVLPAWGPGGVQVGVRETRMALGDHILTGEDTLTARKFDIHDLNGKGTVLRSVPRRDTRDIPLRSLLPRLG